MIIRIEQEKKWSVEDTLSKGAVRLAVDEE